MNDEFSAIDDGELERLADGELSPPALRDLLARVDQSPEGWKRLALMLLEAQALRMTCRATLVPATAVVVPVKTITPAARPPVREQREWLTVAVALLMTCLAGWWSLTSDTTVPIAKSPVTTPSVTPPADLPIVNAVQMAFSGADGEWTDPVTAPVIDVDDPAAREWMTMRPTIPEAVREKLAVQGQRIREQQFWIPVELADGRVGLVPVTDLEVTPASLRDFQ